MVEFADGASRNQAEDELDRVFHSLAAPSRRRILALLHEAGELKVGDIAAAFAMSLNGVSKHVKVLERAGLVVRRIDGRAHRLRADREALRAAHGWLDVHRHV